MEEQLKIERYDINSLENRDYKMIIKLFENNIDKMIPLFRWQHKTQQYTVKYIKKLLKDTKNINFIQKIVADIYNNIVKDSVKYTSKQVQNYNKRYMEYNFNGLK